MNMGLARGEAKEPVWENYRILAEAVGFSVDNYVTSQQTHTTNVRKVTAEDKGKGVWTDRGYTDVDGLITNVPGLTLATFYADCVPLFFVDPIHKAIGLSHSGWKGTVGKIGKVTVEMMREQYGSEPKDILAAIGPSICQSCYEVSEDVIEKFAEVYTNSQIEQICYKKENGKYQLDLWLANVVVLRSAGVLLENIEVTDICTNCNPDYLFSHRASGGKRGNLGAFLQIR